MVPYEIEHLANLLYRVNIQASFHMNGFYNPLRTVAAYMHHGNKNITVCKQVTITSPLFTLQT